MAKLSDGSSATKHGIVVREHLTEWYQLAGRDPRLRVLAERIRGVKPPRCPGVFEALVNAFACQQLSLEVGLELLNRLSAVYGWGTDPSVTLTTDFLPVAI